MWLKDYSQIFWITNLSIKFWKFIKSIIFENAKLTVLKQFSKSTIKQIKQFNQSCAASAASPNLQTIK